MRTIKFLVESVASSGVVYKEGETHSLEDHAAYHWMKRGVAIEVQETEEAAEDQKSPAKRGPKAK
jgi:hypothetical protein